MDKRYEWIVKNKITIKETLFKHIIVSIDKTES